MCSVRDREEDQQQEADEHQEHCDHLGTTAVCGLLITALDRPAVCEESEAGQGLHQDGEGYDAFTDEMHERCVTQTHATVNGMSQVTEEEIKFLDQESEGHQCDDRPHPGEEGSFIGGVIAEMGNHGR